MNIYLNCFLISLLGLSLSVLLVIKSLTTKAKLANVIFDWKLFWKTDAIFSVLGTLLTVGIALMLLGPFLKSYPKFSDNTLVIMVVFSALGYLGSDVASRFFSVVNSRINGAIDFKTTLADTATGTLDAPTPATKPQAK